VTGLQSGLCCFQLFFWQSGPQYRTVLQREHSRVPGFAQPALPQGCDLLALAGATTTALSVARLATSAADSSVVALAGAEAASESSDEPVRFLFCFLAMRTCISTCSKRATSSALDVTPVVNTACSALHTEMASNAQRSASLY
jgi:hypothetical protein